MLRVGVSPHGNKLAVVMLHGMALKGLLRADYRKIIVLASKNIHFRARKGVNAPKEGGEANRI